MIEIGDDKIEDLFELSSGISVATKREFVSLYDFDFRNYFQVKTILGETNACLILRIGAIADYEKVYSYFAELGLKLVNSIEEHEMVSFLPKWYPEIQAFTPKSVVYETVPRAEEIETQFKYPVFLKGERQTNRHRKELCVAENRSDLERIFNVWKTDPILNWQRIIVREFVSLMPIEQVQEKQLQKSYEVRVFVWYGQVLSKGQYWESDHKIQLTSSDDARIEAMTKIVFEKIRVPFMVVDFAKTMTNEWIVIELNDAQESGYAMNSKLNLWNKLIEIGLDKK